MTTTSEFTRIAEWPATERPRERLLEAGPQALSDSELLAIFIQTGTSGYSAVDIAREMLERHDGLRGLLDAQPEALLHQRGMGTAKVALLRAAVELGKRYINSSLRRGAALTSAQLVRDCLRAKLRHYPYEVFAALFLDNRHRVIRFEEMFSGTIDAANVYPREVVKRALELNAAALIVAHNHPSGVTEPSRADQHLTIRLKNALALVDIRLLDHFVVGDGSPVSFAERGLL
jgi:DNA repair protein RadC